MSHAWSTLPLALLITLTACEGDDLDKIDDTDTTDTDLPPGDPLDCEVAIIGGGAGGLHTAFRLAPTLGDGVCLFEKEATLGGRIHDVALDETDPTSARIGAGARRVMEGQQVLFDLATELGLTLEVPGGAADLIHARGGYAFSKEELLPLYPGITPDPSGDTETAFYDQLRFGPQRADITSYADFRAYTQSTLGGEGYQFLRDMSRFRADFQAPLDARGYLDYLDEEWDVCCTASYPVGGMSTFIDGMAAGATAAGARIFTSEPATVIERADGGGYHIVTPTWSVSAAKVVIAAPPAALEWVQGDVVDDLKAQPEYQDILGVKVVTITQWWDDAWWNAVTTTDGTPIWRAWTTDHCLNFIEIPLEPYAAAAKVTRSVYNDDLDCSLFWEQLAKSGTAAVEAEVRRGLELMFADNGLTAPLSIPDPIKTHVQVWPAAWHWLAAGSTMTNADVFAWAVEPLASEEITLVGEAYNPQRSGWSDAAYKSSINALNTRYGMSLPGL